MNLIDLLTYAGSAVVVGVFLFLTYQVGWLNGWLANASGYSHGYYIGFNTALDRVKKALVTSHD